MVGAIGVTPLLTRKRKQPTPSNNLPRKKSSNTNSVLPKSKADVLPGSSKQSSLDPVPTRNLFDILQNNENEIHVQRNRVDEKKPRIPPIVAQVDKSIVNDLLLNNVQNYHMKLTTIGVQIHCLTIEEFKKTRELLLAGNHKFFTHDLKEETPFRVVLTGLEEMDTNELKLELENHNINPIEIKILIPKRIRYDRHANYILYFKRGCTTVKELQETKALFHTIVRWAPFKHFNGQATQCRRCQLPGHGTRNCNLPVKCRNCAESHLTESCPAMTEAISQMQGDENSFEFSWKCANCNGPHAANDNKCPALIDYQNLQRSLSQRNRKQTNRRPPIQDDFPILSPGNGDDSSATTNGLNRRTFSDVLRNQNTFNLNSSRGRPSGSNTGNNSSNLFSYEEFTSLVQEMITGLVRCSSKSEQFQFISSCCFKYVYDSY